MVQSVGTMALARVCKCCRPVVKESFKGLLCRVLQPGWIEGGKTAKRHLLSEDIIRLQDFQERKLAVGYFVNGLNGNFIDLLSEKLQRNEQIYGRDLKILLHSCQSADDMKVATEAIYRYAENTTFHQFKFGPLFIRLCYELGQEDLAAATITDQSMKEFFNDATSFNITTDMLFTKGSYEHALKIIKTMKKRGVEFTKDTFILACGTCYKLNTPESYRICTALIDEAESKDLPIPRHAYSFAVALALRQNDVEKAQSLYFQIINTDSRIGQNLRVLILAMSGEVAEAVSILSAAHLYKWPSFVKKPEFCQEVLDLLCLRSEDGPHMMKVRKIVRHLEEANQVTQQTLDDLLCFTPPGKREQPLVERRISRTVKAVI